MEIRDHNSGADVNLTIEQTSITTEQCTGPTSSPKEGVSEKEVMLDAPIAHDPSLTPQTSNVKKEVGDYTTELDGFEDPKTLSQYQFIKCGTSRY